jgi:hypothetical protein
VDFQELQGKSLAIILIGEDEDWSVLRGIVRVEGDALLLDHNVSDQPFLIQSAWLSRIKPTPADLRDILMNADYFMSLSLGSLPEKSDLSEYESTGLKLPKT